MLKTQAQMPPGADGPSHAEARGFSLVSGGPLYQLWRRTRLSGDAMQFAPRRALVVCLLAWVPLLLLSMAEGHAWGGGVALSFLQDVETQVRLLIAVPVLILAEVRVHRELPLIVGCFVERGLIPEASRAKFDAAIASAMRLRNSVAAELLLIVLVYVVGILVIRRTQFALDVSTWYASAQDGQLRLTYAGWWGATVSMPLVQFLCVRWFFRFFVWARLLWRVSRLDLNLEPTHPDGTAGLHFLALAERAFRPVLLGLGTLLAGMLANRIFYAGAALIDLKVEIVGTVAVLIFAVLGPLLVFAPRLEEARCRGAEEYGNMGQRYAREFNRKWIRGGAPAGEPLVGSADIQSLADLRSGFEVVDGIHIVPFSVATIVKLAAITLLPVAPLLLTVFSVEQLLERVLRVLF